jgi:hypothetical protein
MDEKYIKKRRIKNEGMPLDLLSPTQHLLSSPKTPIGKDQVF